MRGHVTRGQSMRHLLMSGAALFLITPATAQAQSAADAADADTSGDIIVTATRREQALQDIPIAVTAIDSATLERSGATSFEQYALKTPNLSFGYAGTGRTSARLFQIRGIFGQDTSALYIGDISVPTSVDPRVLDVDRVEVLRGPQGDLFGARSMGGLVRLVPTQPKFDEITARGHVGVGAVNEGGTNVAFDATFNLPFNDNLALRATAYYIREAGFIDRLVDPDASLLRRPTASSVVFESGDEYVSKNVNLDQTLGLSVALRWRASDTLTITPTFMHQVMDSDGPPYVDNDEQNLTKIRQFDFDERGNDEWTLAALEARLDLGGGELISSSSYFKRETRDTEDASGFIASLLGGRIRAALGAPSFTSQVSDEERLTQEVRLNWQFSDAFDVVVGGFYQELDRKSGFPAESRFTAGSPAIGVLGIALGDSFFSLASTRKQKEIGIFGQANFKPVPTLTLTAGGRYYDIKTRQTREDGGVLFSKLYGFTPDPFAGTQKENGFNPRVAITWEPSRSFTVYANVARGFRPGFVNDTFGACTALGFGDDVQESVEADYLWNYEGGVKTNFFGGRLRANATAFKIYWKNRQTQTIDCGLGFGARSNVGEAQSDGFEFDAAVTPIDGITISGAVGYTDARITDVGTAIGIAVGDRLDNTPKWNGNAALDIEQRFNDSILGYGRVDYTYVGSSISAQGNFRPSYQLVDVRAGVRFDALDVSLFVRNLTDRRANLSDAPELSDSLNFIAITRPRTIGVDLRMTY
jgi:iron complex outermembrane receptor protein